MYGKMCILMVQIISRIVSILPIGRPKGFFFGSATGYLVPSWLVWQMVQCHRCHYFLVFLASSTHQSLHTQLWHFFFKKHLAQKKTCCEPGGTIWSHTREYLNWKLERFKSIFTVPPWKNPGDQ